jgi:hypothetical protein
MVKSVPPSLEGPSVKRVGNRAGVSAPLSSSPWTEPRAQVGWELQASVQLQLAEFFLYFYYSALQGRAPDLGADPDPVLKQGPDAEAQSCGEHGYENRGCNHECAGAHKQVGDVAGGKPHGLPPVRHLQLYVGCTG